MIDKQKLTDEVLEEYAKLEHTMSWKALEELLIHDETIDVKNIPKIISLAIDKAEKAKDDEYEKWTKPCEECKKEVKYLMQWKRENGRWKMMCIYCILDIQREEIRQATAKEIFGEIEKIIVDESKPIAWVYRDLQQLKKKFLGGEK